MGGDVVEWSDEDKLSGVGSARSRPVSILAVIISSTSLSSGESVALELAAITSGVEVESK